MSHAAVSATRTAAVEIGLNAAIVSVAQDQPQILTVRPDPVARPDRAGGEMAVFPPGAPGSAASAGGLAGLPFGPFTPLAHRTLEIGLRAWVAQQTGLDLGYVEQLYTFGDRGRHAQPEDKGLHVVSIGYLALIRAEASPGGVRDDARRDDSAWRGENARDEGHGLAVSRRLARGSWRSWHDFFPWEDWRTEKPAILSREIEPRLAEWARRPEPQGAPVRPLTRAERLRVCFGLEGGWDEEKVLERYELLYEAGLVGEALRDGREAAAAWGPLPALGAPMIFDHRRILATAMGRLRGKMKYRPVIFELMAPDFTLYELQKTVEAILGSHLHKQNFRRLVEAGGLVEETGGVRTATGGRPAKVYRFRREALMERPAPGVRVRPGR